MVRPLMKFRTFFMLLLLCPLSVSARPSLEVQLKKSSAELGRPVYLKIIGEELKTDMSNLSLDSLKEQFVIDSKDLNTEIVKPGDENGGQKNETPTMAMGRTHKQTLLLLD